MEVGDLWASVSSQIEEDCGQASDSITSLFEFIQEKWNNYRIQEYKKYLVPATLVPAHFQTPVSQGGDLENIYAFVLATFVDKKAIADAQKTTPTSSTCKSGTDGAYCAFFYRFPQNNGAQSSYNAAIGSYSTWLNQVRYAKAFQSLVTAYNALFMGQS